MADTAIASTTNYDQVIHRQQKRISQLRADLARYSTKLRHLRVRASESHHAAIVAAAATAAANANDMTRIHAAHYQAAMFVSPHLQSQVAHLPQFAHLQHPMPIAHGLVNLPNLPADAPMPCVPGGSTSVGGTSIGPGVPVIQRGGGGGRRGRGGSDDDDRAGKTRYWTEMEHNQFLYAVKLFGPKNYVAISEYVATRTPKQVRTHAQKYQMRLEREAKKRRAQTAVKKVEKKNTIDEFALLREGACSPVSEEDGVHLGKKEAGMKKNSSLGNLADYDDFMRRITSAVEDSRGEGSEMFDSESNELDMDILESHPKTEQFEDSLLADL